VSHNFVDSLGNETDTSFVLGPNVYTGFGRPPGEEPLVFAAPASGDVCTRTYPPADVDWQTLDYYIDVVNATDVPVQINLINPFDCSVSAVESGYLLPGESMSQFTRGTDRPQRVVMGVVYSVSTEDGTVLQTRTMGYEPGTWTITR